MSNPNYMTELFNVLKNKPRLQVLQVIANGRCNVDHLQGELKRIGLTQSQGIISEEYLRPLMSVGLACEARDEYYTSTFGNRLSRQLGHFPELAEKLPAHSECYEETLLQSMLAGAKTFKDIEALIPPKSVSRILKRLCSTRLVKTPRARDYVFFFRSQRDPNKEAFTATDQKVYDAITQEGISAKKLSKTTGLSMRLTYKYLRRLRGKKLVFTRKTPKTYTLTIKGKKLALALQKLQQTVEDTWVSSQHVMQETGEIVIKMGGLSNNAFLR